jgi:hypothetical protein
MEYLIGSFSTFLLIVIILYLFKPTEFKKNDQIKYSQTHIYENIKTFLPEFKNVTINKNKQSYNHEKRTNVKVIILDDIAYWIKDNVFYMSTTNENIIDKDSATVVDTMGMDAVELDKMLFIMDKLREGLDNDSGSTGYK